MTNKIIIIHFSEIIRRGVSSLIKKHLNIDCIELDSVDDLANYHNITGHKLILIVDSELNPKCLFPSVKVFEKQNHVKTVQVYLRNESRTCVDGCDCCFEVLDTPEKIIKLLEPCLKIVKTQTKEREKTGLTNREIEVIKLVAQGKTNKEIANLLFISTHTVISHRKNITEKLGIKSISGLTVFAVINNYIDTNSVD